MTTEHIASRPCAKQFPLIVNVGVDVTEPRIQNSDFKLVDLDKTGFVRGMDLNFQDVLQPVMIILKLVSESGGLFFPADPHDGLGIVFDNQSCPAQPGNHSCGMFKDLSISKDRRQLGFLDHNPGNGGNGGQGRNGRGDFRFAMFLVDQNDKLVAVCDPRIIND